MTFHLHFEFANSLYKRKYLEWVSIFRLHSFCIDSFQASKMVDYIAANVQKAVLVSAEIRQYIPKEFPADFKKTYQLG